MKNIVLFCALMFSFGLFADDGYIMRRMVRDAKGMPIGWVDEDSTTKHLRAYKINGTFVGWWDPASSITFESNGKVYARSNLVETLIVK